MLARRLALAAAGCLAVACADDPDDVLRVEGNVAAVAATPASAARPRDADPLASLRDWLAAWWSPKAAIAQPACSGVDGVLSCLATEGVGGSFAAQCTRVRSDCQFDTQIGLDQPGDPLFLFFCFDADGDGICDPAEPSAPLLNFEKTGKFCNGDHLRIADVTIDFTSQSCDGPPPEVLNDGCDPGFDRTPPTATAAPTATLEPGETPATPTETAAVPTATATLVAPPASPPPAATLTHTPTRTPTRTPSRTPTRTATATPTQTSTPSPTFTLPECFPDGTQCFPAGPGPVPCCGSCNCEGQFCFCVGGDP